MNKLSLWLAFLCLLIQSHHTNIAFAFAAVFTVGDGNGWYFGSDSWPAGKTFRSGDVLEFNYNPAFHNVVTVDGPGYNNCQMLAGSTVYNSGNDRITIHAGTNYFICSFAGHCDGGMRIAITAN